jgi:hypothetical protein
LNQVVRLTDLNHDGDALDIGERTVWADGLDDPRGITRDAAGNWFVTEIDDARVWRLTDLNADGDALDIGERTLYADNITQATTVMPFAGGLLVTSFTESLIYHIKDHNADGDALDVGEMRVIVQGFPQPLGLLTDGVGGFYFSSRSTDTVFHASDRNGDGDMLDTVEVLSYADSVFGGVDGAWGMAAHEPGGFLLADYFDGQVLRVHDANGDGDALDLGDVHLFADGFSLTVDIVVGCGLAGDLNCDGFVGILDLNIVLSNWNQNVPQGVWHLGDPSEDGFVGIADLNAVLGNWNAGTPPGRGAVPEPGTVGMFGLLAVAAAGARRRIAVGFGG